LDTCGISMKNHTITLTEQQLQALQVLLSRTTVKWNEMPIALQIYQSIKNSKIEPPNEHTESPAP
jgi:hypothetical protein